MSIFLESNLNMIVNAAYYVNASVLENTNLARGRASVIWSFASIVKFVLGLTVYNIIKYFPNKKANQVHSLGPSFLQLT